MKLFILLIAILVTFSSCNSEKKNTVSTDTNTIVSDKIPQKETAGSTTSGTGKDTILINSISELQQHADRYHQPLLSYCYESSFTIMDDGPHCDLTAWKHGYNDWENLPYKKNKNGYIDIPVYDSRIKLPYPDTEIEALKEAVKNHCDGKWSELIKNTETIDEYPIGMSASAFIFRVQETDGVKPTTFYRLLIDMGC